MPEKKHQISEKDLAQLGRDLQTLYETGYVKVHRVVWFSFLKGVAQGLGIFIGGTIVVALLIWILGFFDDVPLIERLLNTLRNPT